MLHEWIKIWFHWVQDWGYLGIIVLMAMESSIIPVPSEVVMTPAAFWAAQGKLNFWGVVLAGTAGSYLGSAISYWASYLIGAPLLYRYGKYIFLPHKKLIEAEAFVKRFGLPGVFFSRLLPVVRHLISIPAGMFRLPFRRFSVVTTLGAGLWCWVLSWFGQSALGDSPELLNSPEELVHVVKAKLIWFVAAVFIFATLYFIALWLRKSQNNSYNTVP